MQKLNPEEQTLFSVCVNLSNAGWSLDDLLRTVHGLELPSPQTTTSKQRKAQMKRLQEA
jgi:hypothetical protein